jgi:hypothetical protein
MRKIVSVLSRLAAILPAILIVPSSVIAGPLPLATVARPTDDGPKVEKVGCWGYGWRGWGWYPGLLNLRPECWTAPRYVAPATPAVVASPSVVAPVAPVVPAKGRCWVPAAPDGHPGHWAAC